MRSRQSARAAVVAVAVLASSWGAVPASSRSGLGSEVLRIAAVPVTTTAGRPVVVVTGSSSVRLWRTAAAAYPRAQVVNTGFGGSTMADLLRYHAVMVNRFRPDHVVVHEGDNDLERGSAPVAVLRDTRALLDELLAELPDTTIVLVAAKPSPARWHRREAYEAVNRGYRWLAGRLPRVRFADMWRQLAPDGVPNPGLYAADGVHLNAAGYERWSALLAQPRFAPR